jgi:hypothetical protein
MCEVVEEIDNAIKVLSLSKSKIHLLPPDKTKNIYLELLGNFVEGEDRQWWWESFLKPSFSLHFSDGKGFTKITKIVPNKEELLWFIVEDDQQPFYPIYETTPSVIQSIIGECYGFEYYIIPKNKEWLLCENHHNTLIGVGDIITENLKQHGSA